MRHRSLSILAAALLACDETPKMSVERTTVATGEDVVVSFQDPLAGNAMNQYWIALQPAGASASDTTGRIVLERTERIVRLRTSAPGEFEVRLHGRYPKEEQHLLLRVPVTVDGWSVKTGIEQTLPTDECLDRWLAERKLDPFGNPEGTAYAGGTPLFDPTSGTSASRWDYVGSKWPDATRACEKR